VELNNRTAVATQPSSCDRRFMPGLFLGCVQFPLNWYRRRQGRASDTKNLVAPVGRAPRPPDRIRLRCRMNNRSQESRRRDQRFSTRLPQTVRKSLTLNASKRDCLCWLRCWSTGPSGTGARIHLFCFQDVLLSLTFRKASRS